MFAGRRHSMNLCVITSNVVRRTKVRLPYYEDVIGTKPGTGVAPSSQRKLSDVGYQTNHLSVSDVYRVESAYFMI